MIPRVQGRTASMRRARAAAAAGVLFLASAAAGCAHRGAAARSEPTAPREPPVRITALRVSGAGLILDLRYTVLDPDRAVTLVNRHGGTPYVVLPKTRERLEVPVAGKVGALRQAPARFETGRTYFALFANPGREVKAGDRVEVVFGPFAQSVLVE